VRKVKLPKLLRRGSTDSLPPLLDELSVQRECRKVYDRMVAYAGSLNMTVEAFIGDEVVWRAFLGSLSEREKEAMLQHLGEVLLAEVQAELPQGKEGQGR
jgi:hypothetical protein